LPDESFPLPGRTSALATQEASAVPRERPSVRRSAGSRFRGMKMLFEVAVRGRA